MGIASFLIFGFIYLQLGPMEKELREAEPYVKSMYEISHSQTYGEITGYIESVKTVSEQLNSIPLIGPLFAGTNIPAASDSIAELLENAKASSEKLLPALRTTLFLVSISLPGLLLSIMMMVAGYWLTNNEITVPKRQPGIEKAKNLPAFAGQVNNPPKSGEPKSNKPAENVKK